MLPYTLIVVLLIVVFILSLIAQYRVNATFKKYSHVLASRGITGADAAQMILRANGVYGVAVTSVRGNLTDHYDPRSNTIRLSDPVNGSSSVAAIGVAAHEAGHAVQYAQNYFPVRIRTAILPAVQFGSNAVTILILLGFFFSLAPFIYAGCVCFGLTTLFQFVTLPVEFNASRRAIAALSSTGTLNKNELDAASRVLRAAAMTYVAAFAMSLLQLLRLLALASRSRRR